MGFIKYLGVLLGLIIGVFLYWKYRMPHEVELPKLTLTTVEGAKFDLKSLQGKNIFISFFATWCPPCMKEMPTLYHLKSDLGSNSLEVICISDEPIEKLGKIQKEYGDRLLILHCDESREMIHVPTIPTNFVYNKNGKKVFEKVGEDDWSDKDLQKQLINLLN